MKITLRQPSAAKKDEMNTEYIFGESEERNIFPQNQRRALFCCATPAPIPRF